MTQALTIIENNVIAALPVQLQSIVTARFQKPIKAHNDVSLATEIKNMIIVAHMEMGLKIEGKDEVVTFIRDTLFRDLRVAKYEHLTLELIKLFISKGIRGEFPSFKNMLNTINVQNIHYWIGLGLKSEEYLRGIIVFNQKVNEEEKRLSASPKSLSREELINHCLGAFEDYKKDGSMPFAPHGTYEAIKELKEFQTLISQSDWQKVKKEAKQNLINLTKSKAARKTDIPGMLKKLSFKVEGQFEYEIKKVGLKYYFDNLIKENKELEFKQYLKSNK